MLKEKIHSSVKVVIYSLTTLFLILACEIGTNNESLNLRSNFSSEDPLLIVDGQEVINRNIIDSLNPEEIERVDVRCLDGLGGCLRTCGGILDLGVRDRYPGTPDLFGDADYEPELRQGSSPGS